MPLSINEIKVRAARFANEWKNATREEADAQEFEIDFFKIFGIDRRKVATFEEKVKKLDSASGYIDLFWKGMIMIEMKSRGKDLQKAYEQARTYAEALPDYELPKGILICDFENFHFYDLENGNAKTAFTIDQLADHIELFTYLAGYQKRIYSEQDPVNIKAAELMGKVHDRLKDVGYSGHDLEVYLVRLLFCMFADDTSIFEKDQLLYYLTERTAEDGSDLASKLDELFSILNEPETQRLKNLDEQLDRFPYINGNLFAERLRKAAFDSEMRKILIQCSELDWGKISPAIFGAMFQSVMNPKERRNLGAHYTSEKNIMKVIHPLFLDDLREEFRHIKDLKNQRQQKLQAFHEKLSKLKFLDPACGCGNFLVITYRELRLLEIEVLKELYHNERFFDITQICRVNVDQFYGMEIEEFPAQIAKVALWLMDHQMNLKVRDVFGEYMARIPLKTSPTIVCTNALTTDWESVVPKMELNYILGNPPFGGARTMSSHQKKELFSVFSGIKNNGNLDYVTCWYKKAADYIRDTKIEVGFVSTNSIVQGVHPAILWKMLFEKYGIIINFAHQTFKWANEAKGNAAVFCVIIGFALVDKTKRLFLYDTVQSDPHETTAKEINAYLVDAPNIIIESRRLPLCNIPEMAMGNQPLDDGNYLFTEEEKNNFLLSEPLAEKFFYRFIGADEFINGWSRWCLYLGKCQPNILRSLPHVMERVNRVHNFRSKRNRSATRRYASMPTRFQTENIPNTTYLAIPQTSSERRNYIPVGFMQPDTLCSDKIRIVSEATLYHFGVLTSQMHMAWTRAVCGRLKSDYCYSKDIVYNNFPWPEESEKQRQEIESAAQAVLDVRTHYPESSLADLYDPNTMPVDLLKAHEKLDRLVERAYRRESFSSDSVRVAFLFERYQQRTAMREKSSR